MKYIYPFVVLLFLVACSNDIEKNNELNSNNNEEIEEVTIEEDEAKNEAVEENESRNKNDVKMRKTMKRQNVQVNKEEPVVNEEREIEYEGYPWEAYEPVTDSNRFVEETKDKKIFIASDAEAFENKLKELAGKIDEDEFSLFWSHVIVKYFGDMKDSIGDEYAEQILEVHRAFDQNDYDKIINEIEKARLIRESQ